MNNVTQFKTSTGHDFAFAQIHSIENLLNGPSEATIHIASDIADELLDTQDQNHSSLITMLQLDTPEKAFTGMTVGEAFIKVLQEQKAQGFIAKALYPTMISRPPIICWFHGTSIEDLIEIAQHHSFPNELKKAS